MRVKLSPSNLNPDLCSPHSISTYTCGVTIMSMVCSGSSLANIIFIDINHNMLSKQL